MGGSLKDCCWRQGDRPDSQKPAMRKKQIFCGRPLIGFRPATRYRNRLALNTAKSFIYLDFQPTGADRFPTRRKFQLRRTVPLTRASQPTEVQ